MTEPLSTPIQDLPLVKRAVTALLANGIYTLGDILLEGRYSIAKIPNIGTGTLAQIDYVVERCGYEFKNASYLPLVDHNGITRIGYNDRQGLVFPNAVVEQNIDSLIQRGTRFTVGGLLEVTYLRVLVKRGVVKNLIFQWGDIEIPIDENGNCTTCPEGWTDQLDKWLMEVF